MSKYVLKQILGTCDEMFYLVTLISFIPFLFLAIPQHSLVILQKEIWGETVIYWYTGQEECADAI